MWTGNHLSNQNPNFMKKAAPFFLFCFFFVRLFSQDGNSGILLGQSKPYLFKTFEQCYIVCNIPQMLVFNCDGFHTGFLFDDGPDRNTEWISDYSLSNALKILTSLKQKGFEYLDQPDQEAFLGNSGKKYRSYAYTDQRLIYSFICAGISDEDPNRVTICMFYVKTK